MTLNVAFTDPSNLIHLSCGPTQYSGSLDVFSPLPESFGVDIQSQMTQPFASFIPQGLIQTAVALKNLNVNAGIAIGKFYTGTETPDISFDMTFVAQYDAFSEVIMPVARLYVMAASVKVGLPKNYAKDIAKGINFITGAAAGIANTGTEVVGQNFNLKGTAITASDVTAVLYWLGGPPQIRCYFGHLYALGGADNPIVVSGLSPRFSNNIDYNGLPMQCTVSVTLTLRQPYFGDYLPSTYGHGYSVLNSKFKLNR